MMTTDEINNSFLDVQKLIEKLAKDITLQLNIINAVNKLPWGASVALPWCRESFPELDKALTEWEKTIDATHEDLIKLSSTCGEMIGLLTALNERLNKREVKAPVKFNTVISYNGFMDDSTGDCVVMIKKTLDDGFIETTLPLYLDYCNKSPSGFSWGYSGSGPHQLAFAILFDYTKEKVFSFKYAYDLVQWFFLGIRNNDSWSLPVDRLHYFVNKCKESECPSTL